ncbi:hypothetical protein [Pseudomonas sp.]|uniref:hypothetical protein n=1 Tax=Pseudomonas sp. TaxID=306 RepID=UPI003CC58CB1
MTQAVPEESVDYSHLLDDIDQHIALLRMPYLNQEIQAFDTAQSAISVLHASSDEATTEACCDLLFALIGWMPGVGNELKACLRLVNRLPQRFAKQWFDMLRFVLQRARVKTSPEALLATCFDVRHLRDSLQDVSKAMPNSAIWKSLTQDDREAAALGLGIALSHLPQRLEEATKRIENWTRTQRNTSAVDYDRSLRASRPKPGSIDARVGSDGVDGGEPCSINQIACSNLGVRELQHFREELRFYLAALALEWGPDWDRPGVEVPPPWKDDEPWQKDKALASGERGWLELNLHDHNLSPIPEAAYRVEFIDGTFREGVLDRQGHTRLEGLPMGDARVYYGEDPRAYHPQLFKFLPPDSECLADEVRLLGVDPLEVDYYELVSQACRRIE